MIEKGTRVRLAGNVWARSWSGLTGVVTSDRSGDGSFTVQVDIPPAEALYGGEVIVHQDDEVEVVA